MWSMDGNSTDGKCGPCSSADDECTDGRTSNGARKLQRERQTIRPGLTMGRDSGERFRNFDHSQLQSRNSLAMHQISNARHCSSRLWSRYTAFISVLITPSSREASIFARLAWTLFEFVESLLPVGVFRKEGSHDFVGNRDNLDEGYNAKAAKKQP